MDEEEETKPSNSEMLQMGSLIRGKLKEESHSRSIKGNFVLD